MQLVPMLNRRAFTVEVPAGTYYLGDPCYAVPDHLWHALLLSCDYFEKTPIGEVAGHKVLSFNTAYGDGTYCDQFGNEFGVDAGMIGLVPLGLFDEQAFFHEYGCKAVIVKFERPTTCTTDGHNLQFGRHLIKTGG
jgi:hypothetical protein